MSLTKECNCGATVGDLSRLASSEYQPGLVNKIIVGFKEIGFTPQGDNPKTQISSLKKQIPDGEKSKFRADLHAKTLKRTKGALNKAGAKLPKRGGGEDDFVTSANEVKEVILATGGNIAKDYLNMKHSIENRITNINDCLVVLRKVLVDIKGTPELKAYKKLLSEVISVAEREVKILGQSLDIKREDLDKILKRNDELKKVFDLYQIKPGTAATGKLLGHYLQGMLSIADSALVVNGYLKKLGLTLKEYENLSYPKMQEEALKKVKDDKKKVQVLGIMRYLASNDTRRKAIIKELKGKKGGDGSIGGEVDPFAPQQYTKKVKEQKKQEAQLIMVYTSHVRELFGEVWRTMDKITKHIGKSIKADDNFIDFVKSYKNLDRIDGRGEIKAILGFTNDATSAQKRSVYLNDVALVIEKIKRVHSSGEGEAELTKVSKLLKEFLDFVNENEKKPYQYHSKALRTEAKLGGEVTTSFKESTESLEYYADVNKLKTNIEVMAKKYLSQTQDFEKLLFNALEVQRKANEKEKDKALHDLNKNAKELGQHKEYIRDQVREYIDYCFNLKARMWLVAQAIEIYLKEFNYASLTEYEDFLELKEVLDPIKIIKSSSGATVAALLEPEFDGKTHYYDFLKRKSGVAGLDETSRIYKSKDESIAVIDKDFKWSDYKQKIKDAGNAFHLLKNVLAVFIRIGDKVGKGGRVELRKKTSMTPTQMWEVLSEFLFTSFYGVYYNESKAFGKYSVTNRIKSIDCSSNEILRDFSVKVDNNILYTARGVLKAKEVIFITQKPDSLNFKTFENLSKNLYCIEKVEASGAGGEKITLLNDGEKLKEEFPYNQDNMKSGINFISQDVEAKKWIEGIKDSPILDEGHYRGISYSLLGLANTRASAIVGTPSLPAVIKGKNRDITPDYFSVDMYYNSQVLIKADGTIGSIKDICGVFEKKYDPADLSADILVSLSSIPVISTSLHYFATILGSVLSNYFRFCRWYFQVKYGKKFTKAIKADQKTIVSILNRFQDNNATRYLASFVETSAIPLGFKTTLGSNNFDFLNDTLFQLFSKTMKDDGSLEFNYEDYTDLKTRWSGQYARAFATVKNMTNRYAHMMKGLKVALEEINDDSSSPGTAKNGIFAQLFKNVNESSRFLLASADDNIQGFVTDYYSDMDTIEAGDALAVTSIHNKTASIKKDNLYLAIFMTEASWTTPTSRLRGGTNGIKGAWELFEMAGDYDISALQPKPGFVFPENLDKRLNYKDGGIFDEIGDLTIYYDEIGMGLPKACERVCEDFKKLRSYTDFGIIINIAGSEEIYAHRDDQKKYVLAREGSTRAVLGGIPLGVSASETITPIIGFKQEHELFRTIIKAMFSKVNSTIGIHNIFNHPGSLSKFSPERIIMGASSYAETFPEAIELYIRLPLFIEAYKKIFLSQADLNAQKFEFNTNTETKDFSITFLPEMRGTIFGPLFDILWRKVDESDFYSEVECVKIIEECNIIYQKNKGPDMVRDVITTLVEEVNSRYGKVKISDIEHFKEYVRETSNFDDRISNKEAILPGEDEVDIPGALPINMMGITESIDKAFYDMKTSKNLVYDFMSRLAGYLDNEEDSKKISKETFRSFIKGIESEYKVAKNDQERFEISVKAIRGVNSGTSNSSIIGLIIHEMIKTPLNVLSEFCSILKPLIGVMPDYDIKGLFTSLYDELKDANPAARPGLVGDLKYSKLPKRSTTILLGSVLPLDSDDFKAGGGVLNMRDYAIVINASAGDVKVDGIDLKIISHIEFYNWGEHYGRLLDRLSTLTSTGLFVLKNENDRVTFEYSEFKTRVETLFEQTKQLLDFFRSEIDIKPYEDKYFELEKLLYKEMILGQEGAASIKLFKTRVNEGYDTLKKYKLDTSQAILKRVKYAVDWIGAKSDKDDIDNKDKSSSVLTTIIKKEESNKDLSTKEKESIKKANLLSSSKPWNNAMIEPHDSLMIQFNCVIDHFLKDIFDWSTHKIYSKLLYSLTAGNLTSDIQQSYKAFSVSRDMGDYNLFPNLFPRKITPYLLSNNVSYLLGTFVASYTKGRKTYIMDEFSELSDPYKEKLKANLPIYMILLKQLINKGDTIKNCFPKSKVNYLSNSPDLRLGPFKNLSNLSWSAGTDGKISLFVDSGATATNTAIPTGTMTYQELINSAFPEIKAGDLLTAADDAAKKAAFDDLKLRNKDGDLITVTAGAWHKNTFSDPDFFKDFVEGKFFDTAGAGDGANPYTGFRITDSLVNARAKQRKNLVDFFRSEFGVADTSAQYSAPVFLTGVLRKDRYAELMDFVDKITSNCTGLLGSIDLVMKELDDVPLHGETNQRFIEQYKSLNGKFPFMPISITSYHFKKNNTLFTDYGTDEFKLAFATRGVRGAFNLKKMDIDSYPGLEPILKEYEMVYKKIDTKCVKEIIDHLTYLSRFVCFYRTNAALYNVPYSRSIDPKVIIFDTKETDKDCSLKQVLDLMESTEQVKQKAFLADDSSKKSGQERDLVIKINIADLNINPLSVWALYRQVPFVGSHIYAYNSDLVIAKTLGVTLLENEKYHDFVRKSTKYGAGDQRMFELLRTSDTKYIFDVPNYCQFLVETFGEQRPKLYQDEYFPKEIVSSLLFISTHDASGPRKPITNPNIDIDKDASDKIILGVARRTTPFNIRYGDSDNIPTAFGIDAAKAAERAEQARLMLVEGKDRMNLFGVQQLHFIEVIYNITKRYLIKQILNAKKPDWDNKEILQSMDILSNYLGIDNILK